MGNRSRIALAICAGLLLSIGDTQAQHGPVALLNLSDAESWQYGTNAEGKLSIGVVPAANAPSGLQPATDKVFMLTSKDVPWEQWWWCGTVILNSPVPITAEYCNLKIAVYGSTFRFGIILKSAPFSILLEAPDAPIQPGRWNTFEFNLSGYIGDTIRWIELVPHHAAQTVYVYP